MKIETDIEHLVLIEHYACTLGAMASRIRDPGSPSLPHTSDLIPLLEKLRVHVAALNGVGRAEEGHSMAWAIEQIGSGYAVRRRGWSDKLCLGSFGTGRGATASDLLATDWVLA